MKDRGMFVFQCHEKPRALGTLNPTTARYYTLSAALLGSQELGMISRGLSPCLSSKQTTARVEPGGCGRQGPGSHWPE